MSGDITIGEGAIIGANAFVNRSVPKNTVAAGIPAKFIRDTELGEVEDLLGLVHVHSGQ